MIRSNRILLRKLVTHVKWYRKTLEEIANEEDNEDIKTNLKGITNDLRVTEILANMVLQMVRERNTSRIFSDIGE